MILNKSQAHGLNIMRHKSQFIFEIESETPANVAPILDRYDDASEEKRVLKARLDKWLWAARFFKTRALARSAIENGKVFYDGHKATPSKEITIGATLEINQAKFKKLIIVRGLSTRRHSNDEANTLFEELSAEYISPEHTHVNVYVHQD